VAGAAKYLEVALEVLGGTGVASSSICRIVRRAGMDRRQKGNAREREAERSMPALGQLSRRCLKYRVPAPSPSESGRHRAPVPDLFFPQ
jgi:hypothetical protein